MKHALCLALALSLSACAAAQTAAVVIKPSGFGIRNDERFGRCYSGGVAIAGQFEATMHLCGRFIDGGAFIPEAADASAPAPGAAE